MSIKLVVMKSGEQIITDIQEMVADNRAIGYYLNKPCVIQMVNRDKEEVLINGAKTAFDISLYPWIPLAKGETVTIPLDWAVTIVDPVDMLMEMYQTNVIDSTKKWGEGLNRDDDETQECKTCR